MFHFCLGAFGPVVPRHHDASASAGTLRSVSGTYWARYFDGAILRPRDAITVWLLLTQSPATFVLVKSVLGPITTTCTLVVAGVYFRAYMARSGTRVVFGSPASLALA